MIRIPVLYLVTLTLLNSIDAAHFNGGTISWVPVYPYSNSSPVLITITQSYSWVYPTVPCAANVSTMGGGGSAKLVCTANCTTDGGYSTHPISVLTDCTSFSATLGLTLSERSVNVTLNADAYFWIAFNGSAWRSLDNAANSGSAGWSIVSLIDLRRRPDGLINTPPIGRVTSPQYLVINQTASIPIQVSDVNLSDDLRCRWASKTGSSGVNECGDVCSLGSAANMTNLSDCTLTFTATKPGVWYAISLQVEDFINTTSDQPMSSVPVQFLIYVLPTPNCTQPPQILPLTGCLQVQAGIPVNFTLYIMNFCNRTKATITDLILTIDPGMQVVSLTNSSTNASLTNAIITWTPQVGQLGVQQFCTIAYTNERVQSNQYCDNFTVITTKPCVTTTTSSTTSTTSSTTSVTTSSTSTTSTQSTTSVTTTTSITTTTTSETTSSTSTTSSSSTTTSSETTSSTTTTSTTTTSTTTTSDTTTTTSSTTTTSTSTSTTTSTSTSTTTSTSSTTTTSTTSSTTTTTTSSITTTTTSSTTTSTTSSTTTTTSSSTTTTTSTSTTTTTTSSTTTTTTSSTTTTTSTSTTTTTTSSTTTTTTSSTTTSTSSTTTTTSTTTSTTSKTTSTTTSTQTTSTTTTTKTTTTSTTETTTTATTTTTTTATTVTETTTVPSPSNKTNVALIVGLSLATLLLVSCCCGILLYYLLRIRPYRRRRQGYAKSDEYETEGPVRLDRRNLTDASLCRRLANYFKRKQSNAHGAIGDFARSNDLPEKGSAFVKDNKCKDRVKGRKIQRISKSTEIENIYNRSNSHPCFDENVLNRETPKQSKSPANIKPSEKLTPVSPLNGTESGRVTTTSCFLKQERTSPTARSTVSTARVTRVPRNKVSVSYDDLVSNLSQSSQKVPRNSMTTKNQQTIDMKVDLNTAQPRADRRKSSLEKNNNEPNVHVHRLSFSNGHDNIKNGRQRASTLSGVTVSKVINLNSKRRT